MTAPRCSYCPNTSLTSVMTTGVNNGVPRCYSVAKLREMIAQDKIASSVSVRKCATIGCEIYACDYHAELNFRDANDEGKLVCLKQCYAAARRAHLISKAASS